MSKHDNGVRLNDLVTRLDAAQTEDVRHSATLAYGYGRGRIDALGPEGMQYSAWDFSIAYALATAEFRAGVMVGTPVLHEAWAYWTSKGVVDEYRRRRRDADIIGR